MKEITKKWQFWAILLIVITLIIGIVIGITISSNKEDDDETKSSHSRKKDEEDDDESNSSKVITRKEKTKRNSAEGRANDALNVALSYIQTSIYAGEMHGVYTTKDVDEDILKDELTKEMEDYKIKSVKETGDGFTIKFKDDDYQYEAEINQNLTIRQFSLKD